MNASTSSLVVLFVLLSSSGLLRAQPLLERLEQRLDNATTPDAVPPAAAAAEGQPGYLGLTGDDFGEGGRGVRIISVRPGGAAERSGLKPGDLITAINGQAVARLEDMYRMVGAAPAGTKVDFKIQREGNAQLVAVTLAVRPTGAPAAAGDTQLLPAPPAADRAVLGINVAELTADARLQYGLLIQRGALISAVRPGSPADRYGLPIGGVIVAVDGQRVDVPGDLIEFIRSARPGQAIELTYYRGTQVYRKTVRLAPESQPPAAEVPPPAVPADPPLRLAPAAEDRPVLRRLERALDGIVGPPVTPPAAADQLQALTDQIQSMQRQIDGLRQRLDELEQRLPKP